MRAPTHRALKHFETIAVPLDGTRAPGQGDASFDRLLVRIPPGGEASPGLQRTGGGAREPRTDGSGSRRSTRRSVRRLPATPRPRLSWTPAAPPRATAIWASHSRRRAVRRAQGATTPGRRSVKMRREQRPLAQQNFRTCRWRTTRHGAQGRSATGRLSRLWMRRVGNRHTGQGTNVCVDCTCRVTCAVVVSRCHVSRSSRDA